MNLEDDAVTKMWDQIRYLTDYHLNCFGVPYRHNTSSRESPTYAGIVAANDSTQMIFSKGGGFYPKVGDHIFYTDILPIKAWAIVEVADQGFTWRIRRKELGL